MKNTILWSLCVTISIASMSSCKKETNHADASPEAGEVEVLIDHKWGNAGANFNLGQNLVHPMTGDTLNYTTFKYYVSNLKLRKSDGTWWVHPESYFLVDASVSDSKSLEMDDVPLGTYTGFTYTLGVDSARNVSGAQAGALATTHGMFWTWNSGYIMCKAEGTSPQAANGSFSYHLGGFQGVNNVVMVVEVDLTSTPLIVSPSGSSQIHLVANPAKMFHSYGSVSNGSVIHMPNAAATQLGTDFFHHVQFDHVHN